MHSHFAAYKVPLYLHRITPNHLRLLLQHLPDTASSESAYLVPVLHYCIFFRSAKSTGDSKVSTCCHPAHDSTASNYEEKKNLHLHIKVHICEPVLYPLKAVYLLLFHLRQIPENHFQTEPEQEPAVFPRHRCHETA